MLEAKLDENPDLMDYIQGSSPQRVEIATPTVMSAVSSRSSQEVNELRSEIATLTEKIRKLEEENGILQNKLLSKPSAFSPSSSSMTSGTAEEWKIRVEQLEKENFELRKSLLVKRKSESGHSTSRTNLFATLEEEDNEVKPAVVPTITPRTADPRELIRRRLSLNHDSPSLPDTSEPYEHPDWVKKYSDQHKRPYWRNKVMSLSEHLSSSSFLDDGQDKLDPTCRRIFRLFTSSSSGPSYSCCPWSRTRRW